MSPSVDEVLSRFNRISADVAEKHSGDPNHQIVTCGLLTLATVLRDCSFESDMEPVAQALDGGLNRIAEHVSSNLGEIAIQVRKGLDHLTDAVDEMAKGQ